jgi:hypothetical protein
MQNVNLMNSNYNVCACVELLVHIILTYYMQLVCLYCCSVGGICSCFISCGQLINKYSYNVKTKSWNIYSCYDITILPHSTNFANMIVVYLSGSWGGCAEPDGRSRSVEQSEGWPTHIKRQLTDVILTKWKRLGTRQKAVHSYIQAWTSHDISKQI